MSRNYQKKKPRKNLYSLKRSKQICGWSCKHSLTGRIDLFEPNSLGKACYSDSVRSENETTKNDCPSIPLKRCIKLTVDVKKTNYVGDFVFDEKHYFAADEAVKPIAAVDWNRPSDPDADVDELIFRRFSSSNSSLVLRFPIFPLLDSPFGNRYSCSCNDFFHLHLWAL